MSFADLEQHARRVLDHYVEVWLARPQLLRYPFGRHEEISPDWRIYLFPPTGRPKHRFWTYATCGMSRPGDVAPLELHLHAAEPDEGNLELLSAIAHFHRTGARLDVGHTVNFGRPWTRQSRCTHGLVSLPYLDGPALEWLGPRDDASSVRFLWLVPITTAERAYKQDRGLEALEERLEAAGFNYLDPRRASVVEVEHRAAPASMDDEVS